MIDASEYREPVHIRTARIGNGSPLVGCPCCNGKARKGKRPSRRYKRTLRDKRARFEIRED